MACTPGWLCRLPQTRMSLTLRACPRLPTRPRRRQRLLLHLRRCLLFPPSAVFAEAPSFDHQPHNLPCSVVEAYTSRVPLVISRLTATDRAYVCWAGLCVCCCACSVQGAPLCFNCSHAQPRARGISHGSGETYLIHRLLQEQHHIMALSELLHKDICPSDVTAASILQLPKVPRSCKQ